MVPMLEGNEVEKEYDGGAGKLILDVTEKGEVKISNVYQKDMDGFAKVKSTTEIESSIFKLLKKITAKTKTEWDDKALNVLMGLLGIEDEAVIAQAKAELQAA